MSINIPSDVEPFDKKELGRIFLTLCVSTGVGVGAGIFKVFPLAIIAGVVAYICLWLFFAHLIDLYRTPPGGSLWQEEKDRQIDKVNKLIPIVLIVLPLVLCALACIILVCYD